MEFQKLSGGIIMSKVKYEIELDIAKLEDELSDLIMNLEPKCPQCIKNGTEKENSILIFYDGKFECDECDFVAIAKPKITLTICEQ